MKSIRVKTDGWIQGRNGLFDITAVELSGSYDDGVMIDGIGKRDTVINGGLRVSAKAMDDLAVRWLQSRPHSTIKRLKRREVLAVAHNGKYICWDCMTNTERTVARYPDEDHREIIPLFAHDVTQPETCGRCLRVIEGTE